MQTKYDLWQAEENLHDVQLGMHRFKHPAIV